MYKMMLNFIVWNTFAYVELVTESAKTACDSLVYFRLLSDRVFSMRFTSIHVLLWMERKSERQRKRMWNNKYRHIVASLMHYSGVFASLFMGFIRFFGYIRNGRNAVKSVLFCSLCLRKTSFLFKGTVKYWLKYDRIFGEKEKLV